MFYDDEIKFSSCFPPKTGITNWLKALIKQKNKYKETRTLKDIFYYLPRYERSGLRERFEMKSGINDYVSFLTVRHPFSRILSAYRNWVHKNFCWNQTVKWIHLRDKVRKTEPWSDFIEQEYGVWLDKFDDFFQRKIPTLEEKYKLYKWSFPAFMELIRAATSEMGRDKHWRSIDYHCRPCTNDFDFV